MAINQTIIHRAEVRFKEGSSAILLQKTDRDTTGTMTETEKRVTQTSKRRLSNQMGQREAENLPTGSTQIQNCDYQQATSTFDQQIKSQGTTKN